MSSQRQRQLRSSTACRRRLDDLYMPILERMDNGEFSEEGGSDAYNRAMAELREAYQATPNLGCMMNEELETFIRSHTLEDQVEIEDLDEPDEAATNQLGTCQPGNDAAIRLPSGEVDPEAVRRRMQNMQEEFINSFGDQNTRSKVAKVIKVDDMNAKRNSSSVACSARFKELIQPIKDREDRGEYRGEEGHKLYQIHLEKAKREYLDTPDLGVMKGTELDKFIDGLETTSKLITLYDNLATERAIDEQDVIVGPLVKMEDLFRQFRETFQKWINSRSDNINWLELKAASLDEKQKQTNEGILATTCVSGASTTGVVIASLALAPITFGASLAVGGVAAGVGISTRIATFAQREIQRTYDLDAVEEAKKLLLEDKELSEKIVSIIKSLESQRREIIKVLTARYQQGSITDGDFEEVGELNSMTPAAQPNFNSKMPVLGVGAGNAVGNVGGDVGNVVKMGLEIAGDVLEAVTMSMKACEALVAVAGVIHVGSLSLIRDAVTLIQTGKDIAAGSKSKIGEELRRLAEEMKQHVDDVCEWSKQVEKFVDQAQAVLQPLIKRYPLTVRPRDVNSQSTNALEEVTTMAFAE